MRKYYFIFAVLIKCLTAFCQETPNFAPKTPEAAAFLKYGEYPVDLATGVPNISIPLYTVDLDDYKLPISLDYHASGIKVTQESTWVGLGWNLNFGAQVILSVRDDIDEGDTYNDVTFDDIPDDDEIRDEWDLHPFAFNSGIMTSQNLDRSRVKDVYSFSSPTANGSFYIRNFAANDVVIFPPDASFKVHLTGIARSNMGFEITDNQGNQYLFTDTTETSVRTGTHSDNYISAWYVDKILTANNKEIDFNYQDDGQINDYSYSQRIEVKRMGSNACSNLETLQTQITPVINGNSTTMTAAKKIEEIIFNDGNDKVVFDKVDEREDGGNSYLKFMTVKHKQNGVFVYQKGYEFLYSYFTNTGSGTKNKRLKLDDVIDTIDGSGHGFEYSSIVLPAKDSKSQDFYGYYNAMNNGDSMIPRHTIFNPYYTVIGGAYRHVNPSVNQAGMLTEVHYPTSGWTKFNYETNQYYGIDSFAQYGPLEHVSANGTLWGAGPASIHESLIPEGSGSAFDDRCGSSPFASSCVKYQEIPFTATNASGVMYIHIGMDPNIDIVHYKYARVRVIRDSDSTPIYDETFKNEDTIYYPFSNWTSGTVVLEVYGEDFWIDGFYLEYYNTYPNVSQNLNAGGLRVGSIENYNFDNQLLTKKQYSYTDKAQATITSGKLINDLAVSFESNTFNSISIKNLARENILCDGAVDYTSTYSISSNSRYGIEGNSVIYRYVREQQIDSNGNPNGYTDYEFTTEGDEIPFGNSTVQIYKPWKRGKVLVKEDYKISNSIPYKVRKETNNYFEDNSKISYINGFKLWRQCSINFTSNATTPSGLSCPFNYLRGNCFVPGDISEAYEVVTYNLPVLWYYLKNTSIEEYFYDNTNALTGTITRNKTYNYNNPLHQQLNSEETASSNGDTLKSEYFYPQDTQVASEPYMGSLTTKNMISAPVVTKTYKNAVKLSEQKTIYKDWGNSLLLPEFIKTAKGYSNLETRVVFTKYDQYGHPLELKRENGMVISYIWGYNKTEPIAKIENATNAQIESALGTTLDLVDETNLTAINNLRNSISTAMVTTYTYIPLVGVSTITDPKGYTITYEYDFMGRLLTVKDADGKILSENEYHYKN